MEEKIDESEIRKFIHRIFRKSIDIGTLTVKSVRAQFLKYTGTGKLDAEQKELFKKSVYDIYTKYANKQQGKNEGSDMEDSAETSSDNNATASSTSTSPVKKKIRTVADNKSVHGTAYTSSNEEEINNSDHGDNSTAKLTKKHINKQTLEDEDRQSSDLSNDEYKYRKKIEANKQESSRTKSNVSSDEEQASKKKMSNHSNAKVNGRKKKSIESSDEEDKENEKEEVKEEDASTSNKFVLKKNGDERESENSSSSESVIIIDKQKQWIERKKSNSTNRDVNEDVVRPNKKKASPGNEATKKKSSSPSEDSARLRNLKRYARTCGMHLKYVDIFADCKSMSKREKKLEKVIRDRTGFEGRITLQMCVKYKKKKEEEDEVAELDRRNIIATDSSGRRPTRSTRTGSVNQPPHCTLPNPDALSVFSRLKGIVDSGESDSEDDKRSKKKARLALDREEIVESKMKRRRVESSSDEDDD